VPGSPSAPQATGLMDVTRVDHLGRTYVACPAGQPPHSELALTEEEEAALIRPAPSLPKGHMTPVAFGFAVENTVVGEYVAGD
jgi:hypothetical protein